MSEEIEQKRPAKATGTLLGAPVAKERQYMEGEVVKPKNAGLSSRDQLLQQGGLANAIVSEHERFRQLFNAFRQCKENERDRKWNIMQELIEDISSHSSAECRTLYPEFYRRVSDAKLHYDKLLTDDQVNLDILAFLDQHKPTNSNDWSVWEETCVKFFNIEELHMQDEENKVLPKLLSVLSIAESNALAEKFRDKKSTAPLKPHPAAPITEMAATVTHPIQGAIDRMAAGIKNLMSGTTY